MLRKACLIDCYLRGSDIYVVTRELPPGRPVPPTYNGQVHEKVSAEFFAPIGSQFGQGHLHFRQAIS
jgi:hypothetical protein